MCPVLCMCINSYQTISQCVWQEARGVHRCSNLKLTLEKGGGDTDASFGPLVSGIGGQFADAAGFKKVQDLWSKIQVSAILYPALK